MHSKIFKKIGNITFEEFLILLENIGKYLMNDSLIVSKNFFLS